MKNGIVFSVYAVCCMVLLSPFISSFSRKIRPFVAGKQLFTGTSILSRQSFGRISSRNHAISSGVSPTSSAARPLTPGEEIEIMNALSSIIPDPDEAELFSALKAVVHDESLGTTIRVAGGWVRDKLLGVRGKEDIDIALDNMAGKDFALILNTWYEGKGLKAFKIGVIQQNPEKSKHLETATVQLGKFSVDFVNLRTETYAENSRIPGTQTLYLWTLIYLYLPSTSKHRVLNARRINHTSLPH